MRRAVYFWKGLVPLLRRFCGERGVSVNRVVNLAVGQFLGGCDVEELRLKARLLMLLREEMELRRIQNTMLRSGSYLPAYVARTLREPGRPLWHVPDAQRPLKALSPREERVFRRIAARREMIAREIAEICERLLKDVKPFRLKPEPRKRKRKVEEVKGQDGEGGGVVG